MKQILQSFLFLMFLTSPLFSQSKFGGYMFGDYYYNFARDRAYGSSLTANRAINGAAPGPKDMQAFQIRRIYFQYDNDISEQFTARLRLEADRVAFATSSNLFVKDAYLNWKNIFAGSNLIFGIQPTPAFEVSEGAWGYRSLEKTIMDLRGIVPSRDLALSLKGKLTNDGMFNYWVMIGNGAGTTAPENDKYKRFYVHLQLKPIPNVQLTLYADLNGRPQITNPYSGSPVGNNSATYALFAGYGESGKYNVGIEGFLQSASNAFNNGTALTSRDGRGITIFGSFNFQSDLALVARYDNFDPNTDSNAKGDSHNYIIAGLSWKVDKNVSITPNILYETYESNPNGTSHDPSVSGRLTFYYIFL
jgi:hypothetical protein